MIRCIGKIYDERDNYYKLLFSYYGIYDQEKIKLFKTISIEHYT